MDIKSVFKDWRIDVMILAVILSFLAIQPNLLGVNGAQVIYLSTNSYLGNLSAIGSTTLSTGSIITSLNGIPIHNAQEFYSTLNKTAIINSTLTIGYSREVFPYVYVGSKVSTFITKDTMLNSTFIQVQNIPSTALNYGLDIIGGTQITIAPNATSYNSTVLSNLENVMQTRLNTYGLSGITISTLQTVSQGTFIQVSMPNVGESQALSLIQNQGNFYATIGNTTIFNSSNKAESILTVCLTSSCPYGGVQPPTLTNGAYQFSFGIQISKLAADNFANATKNLTVLSTGYLSEPINLFLNGKSISSLQISSNLKDKAEQTITISGSGASSQQALTQMKTLQSTFQSGSLPVPIKIISINSVSSTTGSQFLNQIYVLLIAAFIGVAIMMFLRYNDYRISSLILLTSIAEIFIVIGLAAAIKWTLDVPSIAGIIASIGISVDDQIIITDEIIRGAAQQEYTVTKKRIKRAFFIIFVSFFSFSAIMFPLLFSSATLFTGFALTTILASLIGLLITRPAFAQVIGRIKS